MLRARQVYPNETSFFPSCPSEACRQRNQGQKNASLEREAELKRSRIHPGFLFAPLRRTAQFANGIRARGILLLKEKQNCAIAVCIALVLGTALPVAAQTDDQDAFVAKVVELGK